MGKLRLGTGQLCYRGYKAESIDPITGGETDAKGRDTSHERENRPTGQSKETHKRENRGQDIETTTIRETEAGDIEIIEGGKLSSRQRDHSGGEGEASTEKHHLGGDGTWCRSEPTVHPKMGN